MKQLITLIITVLFLFHTEGKSATKVYLIHGYAGSRFELLKIEKAIKNEGYDTEILCYPSLRKDIDSVGNEIFKKIQAEKYDSISFVTHSMGALVVRSLYNHPDSLTHFPFIHRFVMIAPPNNGTPTADFVKRFGILKFIFGPNIKHLTTDTITGAVKFPVPTCETGLIAGSYGNGKGPNVFVYSDNDGVLVTTQTRLGNEKDIALVKSQHLALLFNKKTIKYTIRFLKTGNFGAKE